MGVWDYFSSATETVKQYTPDLTPVKSICGHGWSAVTKVDNAVRVVAVGKLSHYWRDEQARSDLTRFAADFAKNTGVYVIEEGVKTVPGGAPAYKIFSRSLRSGGNKKCDDKKLEDKDEKIMELSARIEKLEKQMNNSSSIKLHEQTEIQSPGLVVKSSDTIPSGLASNQSPEDVKRVFMMKEFIVTQKTLDPESIPVNATNTGIEDAVALRIPDLPQNLEDINNDVNAETNSPVKDKVGIWGYISSAIGAVKQKIVDFCKRSCNYGWFAVEKVDNAVRVDGVGKLKNYVRDNEALSYLAEVVIEIAKDAVSVAIREKVRRVPGGIRAYNIVLQSLHRHGSWLFYSSQPLRGGKEVVKLQKEIGELHSKIETLEKESCGCTCNCRKLHDQTEFSKLDLDSTSESTIH